MPEGSATTETPAEPAAETTPPAATGTETPINAPTGEQAVPYARFKEINDAKVAAEKAAADAAAELQKIKDADLSEKERAEKAASEATARAEAAEAKATKLERSALVREAAKNFNDPGDAVAMLDLSEIDDADKAAEAVKKLGESKPHLVKAQSPTAIGAPLGKSAKATGEIPTGADGKPDMKAGLGTELLNGLFGKTGG